LEDIRELQDEIAPSKTRLSELTSQNIDGPSAGKQREREVKFVRRMIISKSDRILVKDQRILENKKLINAEQQKEIEKARQITASPSTRRGRYVAEIKQLLEEIQELQDESVVFKTRLNELTSQSIDGLSAGKRRDIANEVKFVRRRTKM